MNKVLLKQDRYLRRKRRVRAKISGTAARPRLAVFRSLQHISCQLIDDTTGTVLAAASDRSVKATGTKIAKAEAVGAAIAAVVKDKGIKQVVFDRAGRTYHGRVQALAEAARAGGLEF